MSEKFQNKYTIKSTRLENYDYSQNGLYFVTICTKNREELFGEIVNEKMILDEVGKIANQFWQEIPNHFPIVNLDEFVVMPNHVHGILEIMKDNFVETPFMASRTNITSKTKEISEANIAMVTHQDGISYQDVITCQDAMNRVSTGNDRTKIGGFAGSNNPMLNPCSLSKIIRWFKGRCAFEIRNQLNPVTFSWQPKFYDHIIRNDESLNKIREYIIKNPEMWGQDRNNVDNVFM